MMSHPPKDPLLVIIGSTGTGKSKVNRMLVVKD